MEDLITKRFLDEEGLALYDELIKAYVDSAKGDSTSELKEESERAQAAEQAIIDSLAELGAKVGAQGLEEGQTVIDYIDKAVADVVNSAPEAFDTLKEIADWISDDESGAVALIDRVKTNEEDIAALKESEAELREYVDARDLEVYNAIQSVEDLSIVALFPIAQAADETAAEAIANLGEGKALKLAEDQTITEDLVIDKACVIDANGSTFEGTVTVPAGVNVVIENATFSKPVVVA